VIEVDIHPSAGIMAGGAVGSKLAAMRVLGGVAGVTILRRAFEYVIHVTGRTLHIHMPAGERKTGLIVIEAYILPGAGVMAGATVCAELSVVHILGGMARKAVCGRPLINTVEMTC
jgi:hypothetical protein